MKKGSPIPQSQTVRLSRLRAGSSLRNNDGSQSRIISGTKISALTTSIAAFTSLSLMAHVGLLTANTNAENTYTRSLIQRDQGACLVTVVLATSFVKLCTTAAKYGILAPHVTRKIIHTFSAPFFIMCWPLYSDINAARYFASIIMMIVVVRLVLAGTMTAQTTTDATAQSGCQQDESELANAVSRSGDAREALGGPLMYAFNVLIATIVFWRTSVVGVVAISVMAAGDGLSDLFGRRWGRNNKWKFSTHKSVVGTVVFFLGSTLVALGLVEWLRFTRSLQITVETSSLVSRVVLICALSSLVELIPIGNDNLTVPIFAMILTKALLE